MAGTVKAETRPGPRSASTLVWSSMDRRPPTPVETTTAARSGSTGGRPASSMASLAAATARWTARSVRLAALRSMYSTGSKSGTSPAILTGCSEASNSVTSRIPECPEARASQNRSRPTPTGVTGPIPVTTTDRSLMR